MPRQILASRLNLSSSPFGRTISYIGERDETHPWKVMMAVWFDKKKMSSRLPKSLWMGVLKPGFVNGIDPVVRRSWGEAPEMMGSNVAYMSQRAAVGGGKKEVGVLGSGGIKWYEEERDNVPLLNGPFFMLDFDSGITWPNSRAVPYYIERMGVRRKVAGGDMGVGVSDMGGEGIRVNMDVMNEEEAAASKPQRYAKSLDIVLAVARPTLETRAEPTNSFGVDGQLVNWYATNGFETVERYGARPFLLTVPDFEEEERYNRIGRTAIGRWQGVVPDNGLDRCCLARAWAISPVMTLTKDSPPLQVGEDWQVEFEYKAFRNLKYKLRWMRPYAPPEPIPYFSGLVGGIGDAIINQNLALNRDLADRFMAAFQEAPEGRFWG